MPKTSNCLCIWKYADPWPNIYGVKSCTLPSPDTVALNYMVWRVNHVIRHCSRDWQIWCHCLKIRKITSLLWVWWIKTLMTSLRTTALNIPSASWALSLSISFWNSLSSASFGSSLILALFLIFLARFAYLELRCLN